MLGSRLRSTRRAVVVAPSSRPCNDHEATSTSRTKDRRVASKQDRTAISKTSLGSNPPYRIILQSLPSTSIQLGASLDTPVMVNYAEFPIPTRFDISRLFVAITLIPAASYFVSITSPPVSGNSLPTLLKTPSHILPVSPSYILRKTPDSDHPLGMCRFRPLTILQPGSWRFRVTLFEIGDKEGAGAVALAVAETEVVEVRKPGATMGTGLLDGKL